MNAKTCPAMLHRTNATMPNNLGLLGPAANSLAGHKAEPDLPHAWGPRF